MVGFLKDLRDQFLLFDPNPAKIAGIIINMFDARRTSRLDSIEEVVGYVNQVKHENDVFLKRATVFQQKIRNLNDIAKAQDEHRPVSMALPNSQASQDFIQLTDQIMEVLENG